MRRWGRAAFWVVFLLLASCARIPAQELTAYTEAFDKAETAGGLMLDEVAPLVPRRGPAAAPRESCAVDPARGFRPCFSVDEALGRTPARDDPPDIALRRVALGLVADYNRLVADLAAGASAEALRVRIDRLAGLATAAAALAPSAGPAVAAGVGLAAGPFAALAETLEAARAENAAARSLLSAEPEIREIMALLRDDAPALYEIYIADVVADRGDLKIALTEARINGDAAEIARLTAALEALDDPASAANRALRFEEALTGYVRLLDRADAALAALAAAIRAPAADPVGGATDFVRLAVELRILADDFLEAARALRAARP